jgi:ABC-type amino acid transport system permease subunit
LGEWEFFGGCGGPPKKKKKILLGVALGVGGCVSWVGERGASRRWGVSGWVRVGRRVPLLFIYFILFYFILFIYLFILSFSSFCMQLFGECSMFLFVYILGIWEVCTLI